MRVRRGGGGARRSAPASTCPTRAARSRPRSLGLLVLVAAAPSRAQLRAAAVALATGAAAAVAAAALPGVAALEGIAATASATAPSRWRSSSLLVRRRRDRHRARRRRAADAPADLAAAGSRRRPRWLAVAVAAGLVIGGLGERPSEPSSPPAPTRARLTTVSSNRYEYWRVGARAFAREPLTGLGRGRLPRRVAEASARSPRRCATPTRSRSRWPPSSGSSACSRFALLIAGVVVAARRGAPPRPRAAPPGRLRRLARVVPARLDRLGLAAARGDPAGGRRSRGRCIALGERRALSGSSRGRAASARRGGAGSPCACSRYSTPQAVEVVGLAPQHDLERAARSRSLCRRRLRRGRRDRCRAACRG